VDLAFWLELTLFILLLIFSGFFSSSETAMFSLSSVQLEQMRRNKSPRIGLIDRMLSEPRRLIVTIQRSSAQTVQEVRVRW
jgi:putative hemolysin